MRGAALLRKAWRGFCRGVVAVFYRHCEVSGAELLPAEGPLLLCANHANALADAVILQAMIPRHIQPLARSGLFEHVLLRPLLVAMRAIPVYRRQDAGSDTRQNSASFARVYEEFDRGAVVLIFPEGQSHSDPHLRELRTGAARIALGAKQAQAAPLIVPVGLNFTNKGRFRSDVLVKIGEPVDLSAFSSPDNEDEVRTLTARIREALEAVTLNAESHEELALAQSLERFFAFRHGKYRQRSMDLRFRALKKITRAYQDLREQAPERLEALCLHLRQFERLCRYWGVRDYQLSIRYRPSVVTRFLIRSLLILFVLLPLALWGTLNSWLPYRLTEFYARRIAHGLDQYDTARILVGLLLFGLFWGGQVTLVYLYLGTTAAVLYAISLPITAATALLFKRDRYRIWDNLRVFFTFIRRRKLRPYLKARRQRLERELAELLRLARRRLSERS
ncbi:MAG TPA: hypothetical protein ENJ01_09720 [Gammaproteobacteria bacterium]|nr:hypothetical protein [Gammaproteobacteria bacterium]